MKKLSVCVALFSILLFLGGCGLGGLTGEATTGPTGETAGPVIPENAILPVMAGEDQSVKAKEIVLTDFTFTVPEGYVYGKVDYEDAGYAAYYVWKDEEDKEYAFELDGDIVMYIYEGLDTNSPHAILDAGQVRTSLKSVYMEYFRAMVNCVNFNVDADFTESEDGKYYLNCFTGNSGEYLATTYGVYCYPKTYYGIYAMEQTTTTSDRRWYGFVFSNDAAGEIFKESEYAYLLNEIKNVLSVSTFYSAYAPDSLVYDPSEDVSQGRSYQQLVGYNNAETGTKVDGLFYDTLLYYVESIGRSYERENVDLAAETSEAAVSEAPSP